VALAETGSAILQGKGAGSGWDIDREVRAHLRFFSERRRPVLFDIGANRGEWSYAMARHFKDEVELWMFEPQEACRGDLDGLASRGIGTLTQVAVGEVEGVADFFTPGGTAGNASLHPRRDTFFSKTIFERQCVKVITLDGFMKINGIEKIDFLKMDIEGHELAALRGAKEALEKRAINTLSFEFGSGNINSRTFFHDFWDLLTGYGYTIYRILPSGSVFRITEYDEDLEYFRGVSNYVAAVEALA
jgi:FkbM family methyltransferase